MTAHKKVIRLAFVRAGVKIRRVDGRCHDRSYERYGSLQLAELYSSRVLIFILSEHNSRHNDERGYFAKDGGK